MALLNQADAVYLGGERVDRIYLGSEKVWANFLPLDMFANGEKGAWRDPSDPASLFQDGSGAPAQFGGTVYAIRDDVHDVNTFQQSSSLRPVYGRVPKGGHRNLMVRSESESFDNAAWDKNNIVVTPDVVVAPDGVSTMDMLEATESTLAYATWISPQLGVSTYSVFVKKGTARYIYLAVFRSNANAFRAVFDLDTATITQSGSAVFENDFNASISVDALGYFRLSITGTVGAPPLPFYVGISPIATPSMSNRNTNSPLISGGDVLGQTVYLWGAQYEKGSIVTPYQQVISQYDIVEPGARSIKYLRFDNVDDRMTQNFPDGIQGDLIICGTEGSWVDENVVIPAGGDLTIGPKHLPNTPDVFSALGDIIGWVLINRVTTAYERRAVISYYRSKGAKGLLNEEEL